MRLACVIPCYNESKRLDIATWISIHEKYLDVDLFFVNDGSTDNTKEIISDLANQFSRIHLIHFEWNKGKAGAVRQAMLHLSNTNFDYVGYLDADLATPFEEFYRVALEADRGNFNVCMGARVKLLGSGIHRNERRHFFSRIIITLYNAIFGLAIYDTQCGCKVLKRSLIEPLFEQEFCSNWMFDMELFIRYQQKYGSLDGVKEIALERWREIGESKMRLKDFLLVPINFLKIVYLYRLLKN